MKAAILKRLVTWSPDEALCPVGTLLTLGEVAQLTEHHAAMIRQSITCADAFRITPGFAFKILESLDEAGRITPEDLAYSHSGDDDGTSCTGTKSDAYPPPIGPRTLWRICPMSKRKTMAKTATARIFVELKRYRRHRG